MAVQTTFHPENLVEKQTYCVKLNVGKLRDIGVFWGFQRLMCRGSLRLYAEFRERDNLEAVNFVIPVWQIESVDQL